MMQCATTPGVRMQTENSHKASVDEAFQQGVDAIGQGKLRKALACFNRACAVVKPKTRHQLYQAWTTYYVTAHDSQCTKEEKMRVQSSCRLLMIRALLNDKRFDAGYVLLGTIFLEEAKPDIARECFLKALSINSKNVGAHKGLKICESKR